MISLSGLITPSLIVVAMSRRDGRNFDIPLLIGGDRQPRPHRGEDPSHYSRGQTVYITDTSRAVGGVNLLSKDARIAYIADVQKEYARITAAHDGERGPQRRLTLARARSRRSSRTGFYQPTS
jgi:5-methyltetrahydrofolate--homocysteine methyltransferase